MRATDPQISFADLEFMKQGIRLEPTLKAIADFLDQHGAIVQRVRREARQAFNDAVVQGAGRLGFGDGTKLRVDTTVVETDIRLPTGSTLLWDAVRVVTRVVGKLAAVLGAGVGPFTNRTRSARR